MHMCSINWYKLPMCLQLHKNRVRVHRPSLLTLVNQFEQNISILNSGKYRYMLSVLFV